MEEEAALTGDLGQCMFALPTKLKSLRMILEKIRRMGGQMLNWYIKQPGRDCFSSLIITNEIG